MDKKYQSLSKYLMQKASIGKTVCLSFSEVEKLLEMPLPASAHQHRAWWSNQNDTKTRPQADAWTEAGYKVDCVNLNNKTVSFVAIEIPSCATETEISKKTLHDRSTSDKETICEDGPTKDWFWEGNVAVGIAKYLSYEGWSLDNIANTFSKERGIDIRASKDGQILLMEVKGYPSSSYRDPKRSGEKKPTAPSLQAQHWYSHALLKALRLQTAHPDALVAIGLPNFPRYQKLFEETKTGLNKLGIALLSLSEDGAVENWTKKT